VVFATLLVSANTIAMSVRERTRGVAVLKTLGFTRRTVLGLFVGEAMGMAAFGGLLGAATATGFVWMLSHSSQGGFFFTNLRVTVPTVLVAVLVAALVGLLSAFVPSYNASRLNIVEGLRHIG